MDWYPHDIEAYDTDTLHLTTAEDGVYSRLLRWYYKNERSLPDDDVALAAIARIGLQEWGPMASRIRAFFVTRVSRVTNARTLHQKRCDAYILKRDGERKGAKHRQEKYRKNNMIGDDYDVSRVTPALQQQGDMLAASNPGGVNLMHPKNNAKNNDLEPIITPSRVSNAPQSNRNTIGVDETQSVESPSPTTDTECVDRVGDASKKREADLMRFEAWWSVVPRKVGKGQARKAYLTALKKTDPITLTEGILRYAAERRDQDPQFTVHPSTWLNGERWADSPEAPPSHHRGPASLTAVVGKILAEDRERDEANERRASAGPDRLQLVEPTAEPPRPRPRAIEF